MGGCEVKMNRAPDLIGARWFFEEDDLAQLGVTSVAQGPFLPCPTANSTFWPS